MSQSTLSRKRTSGADGDVPAKPIEECKQVLIEVPLTSDPPPSEFQLHIDVRLDIRQSTTLRRIARELDVQQKTLANGRRVTESTHAIKWLLDTLSDAAAK